MNEFELRREQEAGTNSLGQPMYDYRPFKMLEGYLDLIAGSDEQQYQNSLIATSSHVFITEDTTDKIYETDRLYDTENNIEYEITYADNVMGLDHHYEIYCKRCA